MSRWLQLYPIFWIRVPFTLFTQFIHKNVDFFSQFKINDIKLTYSGRYFCLCCSPNLLKPDTKHCSTGSLFTVTKQDKDVSFLRPHFKGSELFLKHRGAFISHNATDLDVGPLSSRSYDCNVKCFETTTWVTRQLICLVGFSGASAVQHISNNVFTAFNLTG